MAITAVFAQIGDRRTRRVVAASVLLALLLILIVSLILNVRGRLTHMELAGSDNGQWVMVQTEVEVLRLRLAVGAALGGRADGGQEGDEDIRRWFDVLYSRVTLLTDSPLYATLLQQPSNRMHLQDLRAFTERWSPVMDGPKADLIAALPQLDTDAAEVHGTARALSLAALVTSSAGTDKTRAGLSETLLLLGITTGAVILMLGLLVVMLGRVSHAARREAHENQITGARLQMIIATSADAIVVTNRDGIVVEFNPAAEVMFGIPRDGILGRVATQQIFAPENRAAFQADISDAIGKAVFSGPQRREIEGLRADGSQFPLELSMAVRDLGRGALIVAFMRDISDRRAAGAELQEALRKARAGEQAKARFIAVMSHEMRTPLHGLLGSMGLLRDTGLDADQRELLRVMQVSGDILLGHVNSVLDVSMAEAGAARPSLSAFDLDQLIDDCLAGQTGVARAAGTTLRHLPLTGAFGQVWGDVGRVRQVLLNLIGNAIKFTPAGNITVETERLLPCTGGADLDWAEVRVIDTGIGIAAEDQGRVFQDFETADSGFDHAAGGAGLGLGIARRLVEVMGGQIGVESDLGAGSVFWVRLPLPPVPPSGLMPPPNAEQATAAAPQGSGAGPRLSVLVIEDNDINRFLLRRYLEAAGHEVAEAVDGADGVAQARARSFEVIVTDIAMPHLDGIEAARLIRAQGASTGARIVALTAQVLPDQLARLETAGIDACLTKPVTRAQVLGVVAAPPMGIHVQSLAARTAAAPVMNPAPMAEMGAALDPEVVARLIQRLVAEGDATVARLSLTTRHADPELDARAAHQLAGACAAFGAERLRLTLLALERALEDDPTAAANRAADLLPLWADTRAALMAQARRGAA